MLSCEFCEISQNTFSNRTPPMAASVKNPVIWIIWRPLNPEHYFHNIPRVEVETISSWNYFLGYDINEKVKIAIFKSCHLPILFFQHPFSVPKVFTSSSHFNHIWPRGRQIIARQFKMTTILELPKALIPIFYDIWFSDILHNYWKKLGWAEP